MGGWRFLFHLTPSTPGRPAPGGLCSRVCAGAGGRQGVSLYRLARSAARALRRDGVTHRGAARRPATHRAFISPFCSNHHRAHRASRAEWLGQQHRLRPGLPYGATPAAGLLLISTLVRAHLASQISSCPEQLPHLAATLSECGSASPPDIRRLAYVGPVPAVPAAGHGLYLAVLPAIYPPTRNEYSGLACQPGPCDACCATVSCSSTLMSRTTRSARWPMSARPLQSHADTGTTSRSRTSGVRSAQGPLRAPARPLRPPNHPQGRSCIGSSFSSWLLSTSRTSSRRRTTHAARVRPAAPGGHEHPVAHPRQPVRSSRRPDPEPSQRSGRPAGGPRATWRPCCVTFTASRCTPGNAPVAPAGLPWTGPGR